MRKKLKKILATVLTVATCAVSMTAISSNALYIYNPDGITQNTVSFTFDGVKYGVWQEMNDYFDNENWKFFISEDGTRDIFLCKNEIVDWYFSKYYCKTDEEAVSLKEYLSDNNIKYIEDTELDISGSYTTIKVLRDDYTKDEYFQLARQIKEDTGFKQGVYILESNNTIEVTDVEIELPAPHARRRCQRRRQSILGRCGIDNAISGKS